MPILTQRLLLLALSLSSLLLILIALAMEHYWHLEPCPLCIFQRVGIISAGCLAALGALHYPARLGMNAYAGLILTSYLASFSLALRQLWLQSLPEDQVPACGPSLEYLIDVLPFTDVLAIVLNGDGSCAEVAWSLFGLSIPAWVVVACIPLIIVSLQLFRAPRTKP